MRFVEQPTSCRARFFRCRRSREHACDLLHALILRKLFHARDIALARDSEMACGARGDLRRVGDQQHLRRSREPLKPLADRGRDGAANAAIHFVEHQDGGRARFGKRDFQRQRKRASSPPEAILAAARSPRLPISNATAPIRWVRRRPRHP